MGQDLPARAVPSLPVGDQGRTALPFASNFFEMCQDIALLLYSQVHFKDLPGYAGMHRGRLPENQSSLASAAVCPLLLETLSAHLCVLAKVACVTTGYLPLPTDFDATMQGIVRKSSLNKKRDFAS